MLLTFTCVRNFKLFQMDVKSAFLNGYIIEEVYVQQHLGFEDNVYPNHVCKLQKALYGLKQAPKAWYEHLSKFFIQKHFSLKKKEKRFYLYKYMLMILFFASLTQIFANIFLSSCRMNLKCQ